MQKSNITRWLLIVLPLVYVAYSLWPTYNFYNLDSDRNAVKSDSLRLEEWDRNNGDDYQRAKDKRIKLGLDLRGGMYVTLEVDVLKLIEESADKLSVDDEFRAVIEQTKKETDNTDLDVLETFLKNFRATKMSLLQYFTVSNESDPTEDAIVEKLERDVEGAVDQAIEVIGQRINKYNVSESSIQKQGSRRIQLELPDVQDEEEIRKLLSTTARLDFKRVTMDDRRMIETFYAIDKLLKGEAPEEVVVDSTDDDSTNVVEPAVAVADSTSVDTTTVDTAKAQRDTTNPYAGLSESEQRRRIKADYPFTYMISGLVGENRESRMQNFDFILKKASDFPEKATYRFIISEKDVAKVIEILERNDVKKIMPADLQILLGAKPEGTTQDKVEGAGFYDLFGVASEALLTGDVVTEAFPSFDPTSGASTVIMEMNSIGAERWAQITGANIGKQIAIVLDDRVYSAPNVINKIPNGSSSITGMSNAEEANLLSVVLKAGALKAPVKIIEERVVGPSLGEDSIRRGVTSSVISFAIVVLFMLVYYMMGGGVADIALVMNGLLVVATLAAFEFTLTLPGIAGIILATAMAVDANILIFERIREELAGGRDLRTAVKNGYEKAWSAILDSNVTNFLSGVVLLVLGTGPVKGFALTLIIGVLMTLFTAVVLTRAMFQILISSGATHINFGQKKTVSA